MITKHLDSLKRKMASFHLGGCLGARHCDSHPSTRVSNHSDRTVELQVRVGSMLKKVHTLRPGSSKRLNCKNIYKAYVPDQRDGMKSLLHYYDETCQPYIWVNDCGGDSSRMVKQQYISLEDLRNCCEIRVFRDHQKGCIGVRKKLRPEVCAV